MVSWIRRQYDRFRSRREARREGELQRFIEEALRPENVERCQRILEKQFGRLVLDENGFHLLKDTQRHIALRWADVRTIQTYKRDLLTVDSICIAFEVADDEWIEIRDDMAGFDDVTLQMEELFSGVPEDWYSVVVLPPFATNERTLWRRDGSQNADTDAGE